MDLEPTQQEGKHVWYWKPRKLLRASEVMDPRGESVTASLLNQHNP